jgi:hypothetical protein
MFPQQDFPPRGPTASASQIELSRQDNLGPDEEAQILAYRRSSSSPGLASTLPPAFKVFCNRQGEVIPHKLRELLIEGHDSRAFMVAADILLDDALPPPPPGAKTWLHELAMYGKNPPQRGLVRAAAPISLVARWRHFTDRIPPEAYDELLLAAANTQNSASAWIFLELGARPERALIEAAQANDANAVDFLLGLGADRTAAYLAAWRAGMETAVKRLATPENEHMLAHFSAAACDEQGQISERKLWSLITNGKDGKAFQIAACFLASDQLPPPTKGAQDWLRALARYGIEPSQSHDSINLMTRFTVLRSFGIPFDCNALLACAAAIQNVDTARVLIKHGADATAVLYESAKKPDHRAIACLLDLGANPQAAYHLACKDVHGTAMQVLYALAPNQAGMERLLRHYCDTGAALRAQRLSRQADLLAAARTGDLDGIKRLAPSGVELSQALFSSARTVWKMAPGVSVESYNECRRLRAGVNKTAQKTLLQAGANPSNALWQAIGRGDPITFCELLQLGGRHEESLAAAALHDDFLSVTALVEEGADIKAIIDEANRRHDERLLNKLVEAGVARNTF